ncbi:hypothetical protein EsH8_VIII_001074 [Colletotrichum jinshuiense]
MALDVPLQISEVDLPVDTPRTVPNGGERDLNSPELTKYLLKLYKDHVSGPLMQRYNKDAEDPKRIIKCRKKYYGTELRMPTWNYNRSQAADSIWTQVYGFKLPKDEACNNCQKGNGDGKITVDDVVAFKQAATEEYKSGKKGKEAGSSSKK